MLILATLDDISGVVVPHAIERLMERGANSVHVSQTVTKKGRVGLLFIVDVAEDDVDSVGEAIMTELGSLGYNIVKTEHVHSANNMINHKLVIRLNNEERLFQVNIKKSSLMSGKHIKSEPEVDELSAIIEHVKKELNMMLPMKTLINEIKNTVDKGGETTIIRLK
jgi:uncharacterized protein (DUF111 family)